MTGPDHLQHAFSLLEDADRVIAASALSDGDNPGLFPDAQRRALSRAGHLAALAAAHFAAASAMGVSVRLGRALGEP